MDEIYALLRAAAVRKQPIAAVYEDRPRLFCPHLLGQSKQGRRNAFFYQFGGTSDSGLKTVAEGGRWLALHCSGGTQRSRIAVWSMAHGATIESANLRRGG